MRYDIPKTEYVRAHSVTARAVKCPHASTSGFGKMDAKPGDFVVFRQDGPEGDRHYGRVLGRLVDPLEARGHLSVAVFAPWLDHVMLRWVNPKTVERVTENPTKMMAWFFQPELPSPDMVVRLSCYGTLSERYIHNAEHHMKAWAAGMSPTAYDIALREQQDTL